MTSFPAVQAFHIKTHSPDDPLGPDCPPSFVRLGPKCYFFGYFKLNWFRALEFCHSFGEGVSLACVESEKENVRLKNWLIHHGEETAVSRKYSPVCFTGDHTVGVWIGGSDNGHPRRWSWLPTGISSTSLYI